MPAEIRNIKKKTAARKGPGGPRANSGGARAGAGRPSLAPSDSDRKQVEAMSGYGVPIEQIAAVTMGGIGLEALYNHFREELVAGKAKINAKVGQTLAQKALSGDTAAMIWWSKSRMGFREKVELEHTGKDGGAITMAGVDLKGLNDTELAQMQALLQKANNKDE
jgi:hypothetical protein